MTATHTTRGKVTERMVVRWMREHGFPGAERIVRTGYRTALRTAGDEGDIGMAPGLLAQVKSLRPANRAERAVPAWLAETEAQRVAAGAEVALLVVRRDGTAVVGEWWAWLPLVTVECIRNGDDRYCDPDGWAPLDRMPMRLFLADACRLLRAAGYGEPEPSGGPEWSGGTRGTREAGFVALRRTAAPAIGIPAPTETSGVAP